MPGGVSRLTTKARVALFGLRTFRNFPTYYALMRETGTGRATLKTRDGLSIVIRRNKADAQIVREMFMDRPYLRYVDVPANPVVIDIGSYIGDFALYMAHHFGGRVVACEPTAENRAILEENVRVNRMGDRITVVSAAIGASDTFTLNVKKHGDEVHASGYWYESGERREIASMPLDQLMDTCGIERADIVKIDCEGAEYDILEAIDDATLGRIGSLVFEHHVVPDWESRLSAIKHRLGRQGFRVIDERKIVHAIRA